MFLFRNYLLLERLNLQQDQRYLLDLNSSFVGTIQTPEAHPKNNNLFRNSPAPFARNQLIHDHIPLTVFSGGQLSRFQERWRDMETPPNILKLISGVRIPLVARPNLIVNCKHSRFATVWSPQMSQEIELLKEQKVVERRPHSGPSFISRMFPVQKSSGGLRPIFDLRGLNRHVRVGKFRLISHLKVQDFLQDRDWMTHIDMSQAFLQVLIAGSHRCLRRFVYNKELLQLQLGCRNCSITRYEGGRIFGRLSPRLSRQEQIIGADPQCSETFGVSKLEDQSRKLRSKPLTEDQIPEYPLKYQGQSHEPSLQKRSENYGPIHEI